MEKSIITGLEYLIFGIFKSESFEPYSIYRIDKNNLQVDNTESWHRDRFKAEGYIFKGMLLDHKLFKRHQHLINSIPQEIYKGKLKTHNSPDNNIENKIVLEYKNQNKIYKFTIDLYDINNEQSLTESVQSFMDLITSDINKIKYSEQSL